MKTRILHTRFWQDSYVTKLSHKEKLTFVYILTNDRVSMTGMYELPDRYLQMDLNLTSKEINTIKQKFQKDGKIFFCDGWIKIINHDKYNSYKGEKIDVAKEKELGNIPDKVKQYQGGIDTSIHTSIDTPNNHKSKIINQKIEDITEKDFQEIAERYQVPIPFVRSKYDDMVLWAGERFNNPKTKGRNWKLTLMAWVKKDSIKIKLDSKRKGGFVDATKI